MSHTPRDLFDAAPLPGLKYREGLIDEHEEQELIAAIDREQLSPFRFQGWLGKRLTITYGWNYDFDSGSFGRAAPLPDYLLPLRARAEQFANLPEGALEQALLIRYDPGATIGWHRDRPVFDQIVGISLGASAPLRFRQRRGNGFARHKIEVKPRSVYLLSGEARQDWEHSIDQLAHTRWSITFRSLSDKARHKILAGQAAVAKAV
jgi:alkylated DNA repair dioxygenase AlkB